MEKKTIGKFIAALRRANGMTQRELADRLFVSDKTVSRWECDECTPELSLIPSIAEIFSVTADELLRGERNSPESREGDVTDAYKKAKSDKQYKLMLHERGRGFLNQTLFSLTLAALSLLAALVCGLGFSNGLIGICIAATLLVVSAVMQIFFTVMASLIEEDERAESAKKFNTGVVFTTVKVIFLLLVILPICISASVLHPADYNRPFFLVFLDSTLIFSAMTLIPAYLIWRFCVLRAFLSRGVIHMSESEYDLMQKNNRSLRRISIILASVVSVVFMSVGFLNLTGGADGFAKQVHFESADDFIDFVEEQYDAWFTEGYGDFERPPAGIYDPSSGDFSVKDYPEFGEKLGEREYYYNPNLYHKIDIVERDGEYKITLIERSEYISALGEYNFFRSALSSLYWVGILTCSVWYFIERARNKGKA